MSPENGAAYAIYLDQELACHNYLARATNGNGLQVDQGAGQEFYLLAELSPSASGQESSLPHIRPNKHQPFQTSISPPTGQSSDLGANSSLTSAESSETSKSQSRFVSANKCHAGSRTRFDLQTDV